jgi:hypothetical protein
MKMLLLDLTVVMSNNNLLATGEHGTLLPVVKIQFLFVQRRVNQATELGER